MPKTVGSVATLAGEKNSCNDPLVMFACRVELMLGGLSRAGCGDVINGSVVIW